MINHTPEALAPTPEQNAILANLDRLTEEILREEASRMIEEAQGYLRRAAGDPAADGSPESSMERLDALTALGAVQNALCVEMGHEAGILHMLVRDAHPDANLREAAKQQRDRIQAESDKVYTDEQYEGVYQELLAIDPATLSAEDQQRLDYHVQQFRQARQESSSEAGDIRGQREALNRIANEFRADATKTVPIQITSEEFEKLPAETRDQLKATLTEGQYSVKLDRANLNYLLENGERGLRQRAHKTFFGARVEGNAQRLQQMAEARNEIAGAAGDTWTGQQVKGRLLATSEGATEFLASVKPGIVERYKATVTKLQDLLREEDPTAQIEESDLPYLMKKLARNLAANQGTEQVTFSLETALRGLLDITEKLLAVKIEEAPDIPGWAPGMRAYRVFDAKDTPEGQDIAGENLGMFIVDPLKCEGKKENPSNYAIRYGLVKEVDGQRQTIQLPLSVTIANFTGPTKVVKPETTDLSSTGEAASATDADPTDPNQINKVELTQRQVEVLAHELIGHAFHVVMSRSTGPEFGGDKLKDGLEITSQAFENFVKDPDILLLVADNAESIPQGVKDTFIRNKRAIEQDRDALHEMLLLRTSAFDLAMHNSPEPNLERALEEVQALMYPVLTDGRWPRAQVHFGNPYAGRYGNEYLATVATSKGIAKWLQLADYRGPGEQVFAQVGSAFRDILEIGGHPDAGAKLVALAARIKITQGVGSLAAPSEQP